MHNILKLLALAAAMLFAQQASAQYAITFVGGDASGADGSLSYSGGEPAVKMSIARAITVVDITEYFTEGVQQGFATKTNNINGPLPMSVNVYPNPAHDWLHLNIGENNLQLQYTLTDMQGRTIMQGTPNEGETSLDISSLATGTYMLCIQSTDKKNKNIFKIIKAN